LAHVDTHTCANSDRDTDTYANRDPANTHTGADCYGSTDSNADRDSPDGDTGTNGDGRTNTDTNRCADVYPHASPNRYANT
jgi:hypothetical protein